MNAKELKQLVIEKYSKIAEQSEIKSSCCSTESCCGPTVDYTVFSESYSEKEGYTPEADMNLGCGIPTDYAGIKTGDHVLDLGSGAGNDCFVARAIVGESGKVTGIDMTGPMIAKARMNAAKLGYTNVEFVPGDIEEMPFDADLFDVVVSNCVLNLVPDKSKAFAEIYRVLKPGGHFSVSDVVTRGKLSEEMLRNAELYAGCVSGASEISNYLKIIDKSGFSNVKVHKEKVINLPESLMSELNDQDELNSYRTGETGIFSITVTGEKPSARVCSCGGKC